MIRDTGRHRGGSREETGGEIAGVLEVVSYAESDHQVDLAGNSAVASFRFEMVYARDGASYRSTGRDLWVFERQGDGWLAVWRTMLDLAEEPVELAE